MSKENKTEKVNNKITLKRIIKTLIIAIIGFIVICMLPYLYFVATILYSVFLDIPSKPKLKHGEFPFELVYEYKGKQVTITDTIICDYEGYSWSLEGGNSRDWNCELQHDNEYGQYIIDNINERDLYIEVPEAPDYYMGDKDFTKEEAHPLIIFVDEETGTTYAETDKIEALDIKIIEWNPSEPLKNNIK